MVNKSFRLNIGAFKCMVVSDGIIRVPSPPPSKKPGELMDVSCLLIEQGQRKILVDTGCGSGFQASAGKLLKNLLKEGVNPGQINTIIYTHGHTDHVGGSFDSHDRPVFPQARHMVLRKEFDSWATMPDTAKHYEMFAAARKYLLPIRDQFDLAEENAEIIPGIKLLPAYGHTLGNAMLEISSGKHKILCIGDLIHSQVELANPDYYAFLDSVPEQAVRLRTEGISKIAESGVLVFACHFPLPGIGHFVHKGGILSWQPVHE
ncbi:MAG: MBL fold metallo-hydrolase [Dehalococcoidales bacterium]|jgi:glyoxylase-like metal-dependent hydrolase (beta-lactamase superfamily II)